MKTYEIYLKVKVKASNSGQAEFNVMKSLFPSEVIINGVDLVEEEKDFPDDGTCGCTRCECS